MVEICQIQEGVHANLKMEILNMKIWDFKVFKLNLSYEKLQNVSNKNRLVFEFYLGGPTQFFKRAEFFGHLYLCDMLSVLLT
jgi:hypothetical protein